MRDTAEKAEARAEIAPALRTDRPQSESNAAESQVEELFSPQIIQLGGVPAPPGAQGRQGRVWTFDPARGEGFYWYFAVEEGLAVGAFTFTLHKDGGFACDAPDRWYFGSYSHTMLPYLGTCEEGPDRTVVGHIWKRRPYYQPVHAGERLGETFVALLPSGLRAVSLELSCDPVVLSSAIGALDGSACPAGLAALLDDLRRARPSAVTARAYYRSKIIEACSLIVDWRFANNRMGLEHLSEEDVRTLARAQRLLQHNLHRVVSSDELCHEACVGATKLARLFRTSCGLSPGEYARELRMERACDLLADTDLPLSAVAEQTGFARQGSFSEAFRARFGTTPRSWRSAVKAVRAPRQNHS